MIKEKLMNTTNKETNYDSSKNWAEKDLIFAFDLNTLSSSVKELENCFYGNKRHRVVGGLVHKEQLERPCTQFQKNLTEIMFINHTHIYR